MDQQHAENTKRIAKNTLMLYVRMLFSMLVSLYTSRVVLQALGVEDYGIYNVVGGVVGMLGFLNASMSGATSRFLTFELGRCDVVRLKETFSSALVIHMCIALVVFVVAETFGIWFLSNKLVIPDDRMFAAHIVYQLSIFSTMLGITQVPYNASIIAHEDMNVYAYVEILNVCLRLLIVYLLQIGNYDKLILYAILVFGVSVLIRCIYRWYCIRNYEESRFRFIWKWGILKSMLNFSGWDLYGNVSVIFRQQGVNILMNMFIGPVVNAASAIATSVGGVIMSFVGNVITAFRPQIIKSYSVQNYQEMFRLMNFAVKISIVLFLMLAIPLVYEMDFVLSVWLGIVPEYAADFCRILIITYCFTTVTSILNIGIHATGKVFLISLISGTLILLAVPVIYVLLRNGFHPDYAYICNGAVSAVVVVVNTYILKYIVPEFSIKSFCLDGCLKSIVIGGMVLFSVHFCIKSMESGWIRLICVTSVSVIESVVLAFLFLLDRKGKNVVLRKIHIPYSFK